MAARTVQLVLHYDGSGFSGWQRQPDARTVQGTLEDALGRLCAAPIAALGAGRTDAGVHARGQAVGVRVPGRWTADRLRQSLNAVLPADVWVAAAFEMRDEFHARYSASARRYSYYLGLDEGARSPFRNRWEWHVSHRVERTALEGAATELIGEHGFRAFAVRGTAPPDDAHLCTVHHAQWRDRQQSAFPEGETGTVFEITANRFLHHMVRFLVGTMVDIASGRRDDGSMRRLLAAEDNSEVSPPAPAHALFLDAVEYPADLYLETA
ncbi:MAG: tRNA pseudouridine(38-40) synthase TruA [Gemmatimonadaceae bacterium]